MKEFNFKSIKGILIKNGRLMDPTNKLDKKADILIRSGKIAKIGPNLQGDKTEVLEAKGYTIFPGFFDMHAHLREPGREDQETIESGCAAAVAGGFTGLASMPDTQPATDTRSIVEFILRSAEKTMVDVSPVAAITKERKGEELAEMAELVDAGAVAFSDADHSIGNVRILRHALDYASMFDTPLIDVCEDALLAGEGLMNEGIMSTRLGMHGVPNVAEDIVVARDIHLAEYTRKPMHLAKISTARAVELIRDAKQRGVKITCDVTPHHLLLTENDLVKYDTNFKVKPPLRTKTDCDALIAGLADGTIDAISTDHSPHSPEEKEVEILVAPFGSIGLETAFPALYTNLVETGRLSLEIILEKLISAPRHILHCAPPQLKEGEKANLSMWALQEKRTFLSDSFFSRSRNAIFLNKALQGVIKGVVNKSRLWIP
ncbi:dihydroorotase [candidate division KSB1 bacterium]|nr:dihydroorotase [candidate division KSB1 bacterium]